MTPYQTDIEEQSAECRENWFKDHVAKFIAGGHGDQNKIISWENPKSWNYGCRFIIHRRWLIVVGDIGEATYEWSEDLTLDFLAGLDFGYFHGKCVASEVGRRFDDWSEHVAEKNCLARIAELAQLIEDEDESDGDRNEMELIKELGRNSKDEYREVATEYYDATGDAEGAGSIADMGKIANGRCVGHFIGLQMAIAQLKLKQTP